MSQYSEMMNLISGSTPSTFPVFSARTAWGGPPVPKFLQYNYSSGVVELNSGGIISAWNPSAGDQNATDWYAHGPDHPPK